MAKSVQCQATIQDRGNGGWTAIIKSGPECMRGRTVHLAGSKRGSPVRVGKRRKLTVQPGSAKTLDGSIGAEIIVKVTTRGKDLVAGLWTVVDRDLPRRSPLASHYNSAGRHW